MNIKYIILLIIPLILASPYYSFGDESAQQLYVANSGNSSVSVIDTETYEIIATVSVGKWPTGVTVSPDKKHVYVMNSSPESSSVSVINTLTNEVEDIITNVVGPMHMTVDTITGLAYITDTYDKDKKSVTIIDINNNSVKAKKKFNSIEPFDTVIIPDKRVAYVVLSGGYYVAAFSLIDYMTTARIPVGRLPRGLAYDSAGGKIYVANHDDNSVSIIDITENKVIGTVKVGDNPWYIEVYIPGRKAYVTCAGSNSISVIDTENDTVIDTIEVGSSPRGIAIGPNGKKAYVSSKRADSISVIDLVQKRVIKTIPLGKNTQPWGIALR